MSRVSGEQLESWQEGIGAAPCSAAFFFAHEFASLRHNTYLGERRTDL